MEQFFNADNVRKVMSAATDDNTLAERLLPRVDFNRAFDGLTEVIMQSSFGTALSMFGGAKALQSLREPFVGRMQEFLLSVAEDRNVIADIAGHSTEALLVRVESIVDQRLEQMTPQMVKEIMQKMIEHHLGWLVVWGGVVGALMGAVVALLQHFLY